MICLGRLMESNGFLNALGEFLIDRAGDPVVALVMLWNTKTCWAFDTVVPKYALRHC